MYPFGQQREGLAVKTVMENGPTAASEFKTEGKSSVGLENRYGSLAHREFKSLPLRHPSSVGPGTTLRDDFSKQGVPLL
jgi:hypothetical protein